METPPSIPPSTQASPTGALWGFWIASTIGLPLVLIGLVVAFQKHADLVLPIVLGVGALGLIGQATASIFLAKALAARRPPERRGGAMAGMIIGFLFGGWAIMCAVFFCGCLAAISIS